MRSTASSLGPTFREWNQCRQPGFLSTGCEPPVVTLGKETNTRGVTGVESDTTLVFATRPTVV